MTASARPKAIDDGHRPPGLERHQEGRALWIVNAESLAGPTPDRPGEPDPAQRASFSAFVDGGREDVEKEPRSR